MEQWEKEYLDIIHDRKKLQSSWSPKQQKEYIDSRWEEVVREDGSKWYVPKQEKFRRKRNIFYNIWHSCIKVLRILFFHCLLCLLFWGIFVFHSKRDVTNSNNLLTEFSDVYQSARVRNTYVDGLGLHNMIDTLCCIRDKQNDILNTCVVDGVIDPDMDWERWLVSIDKDLAVIDKLTYDDSYSEVVFGYIDLLNVLREFVVHMQNGDVELALEAYNSYSVLLGNVQVVLTEAFDKNGVKYQIGNDEFTYWYYPY